MRRRRCRRRAFEWRCSAALRRSGVSPTPIECGDAKTKKSLEAIMKKRESNNLDVFDRVLFTDEDDPEIHNCWSSGLGKKGKLCWTNFIDETIGKLSCKLRINAIHSEFYSIGVQIITEENMNKRNTNQSHKAKFYCWKIKYYRREAINHPRSLSYRQIINQKIENPPDVLEKIVNDDEQDPIPYKHRFSENDFVTVVFDQRNRTIEFLKNNTSQGVAFTSNDIPIGRARFFIQMGSRGDGVEICPAYYET